MQKKAGQSSNRNGSAELCLEAEKKSVRSRSHAAGWFFNEAQKYGIKPVIENATVLKPFARLRLIYNERLLKYCNSIQNLRINAESHETNLHFLFPAELQFNRLRAKK